MLKIVTMAALCMGFSTTYVAAGNFDGPSSGNQASTFKGQGVKPVEPAPAKPVAPRQPTLTRSDVVHNSSGTAPGAPPNGSLQGPNRPIMLPGAAVVRPRTIPGAVPGH
jgi:hypothetical protein